MKGLLEMYMDEYFKGTELSGNLYGSSRYALSLKLEGENGECGEELYFKEELIKSKFILNGLIDKDDEVLLVLNIRCEKGEFDEKICDYFIKSYIKSDCQLEEMYTRRLSEGLYEWDDEEGIETWRLVVPCLMKDVYMDELLMGLLKKDFNMRESISHEVFIINTRGNNIYYLYDDRGIDLVFSCERRLIEASELFSDWILESK